MVTGTAGGLDSGVGTISVGAVGCTTGEDVGCSVGFSGAGFVSVTLMIVEYVVVRVECVQNVEVISEWLEVMTEVTGQ